MLTPSTPGVPVGGFLGWAALGAVYGAITGTALVWLLRQRPPGFDQPSDARSDRPFSMRHIWLRIEI